MYRKGLYCATKMYYHEDVLPQGSTAKTMPPRMYCSGLTAQDVSPTMYRKGLHRTDSSKECATGMYRQKDVYCPRMHRKECAANDVPQRTVLRKIYCKECGTWMLRYVTPQGSFAVDMEAGHKHLPVYPTSYVPMLTAVSPKPIIAKLAGERT